MAFPTRKLLDDPSIDSLLWIWAVSLAATVWIPSLAADEAIKVDSKITSAEKKTAEKSVAQSDKHAADQAKALNKVPGIQVTPADLKESKKADFTLNPVAWLFKPITRLQEQSIRLEQQIMKLTGPIAALQPGMLGLEKRMTSVQKDLSSMETRISSVQTQMAGVQGDIGHVNEKMAGVQHQMSGMQGDLSAVRDEMGKIRKPVTDLKQPVIALYEPLSKIEKPITTVDTRLNALDRQLGDLKGLISLVLTSIFIAAAIIAFGTPVAAILIWRNRTKILPKPTAEEKREEHSIERAGKTLNRQLTR